MYTVCPLSYQKMSKELILAFLLIRLISNTTQNNLVWFVLQTTLKAQAFKNVCFGIAAPLSLCVSGP